MMLLLKKETKHLSLKERLTKKNIENNIKNLNQLTFEITENCNLACKYCAYGKYYSIVTERTRIDIPFDYIKNTIDFIFNQKEPNTSIYIGFYGGEPLLKMDIIKQTVEYSLNKAKQKNIKLDFGLTTNAILLNKYIEYFVINNLKIIISLDGDKYANSFRIFHNEKESFDIVYKNIKYVKEKYPGYYKENINFNAVYHHRNNVIEIKKFFLEHFEKEPMIASIDIDGLNPLYQKEFMDTLYKDYSEDLKEIKSYKTIEGQVQQNPYLSDTLRYLINMNKFFVKNYNDLLFKTQKKDYIPTATCLPFSLRMFITARGKILPCERINYKYSLGKVTEEGVEIDFQKIADKYNSYYDKLAKQCNVCAHKFNCQYCMLQMDMDIDKPKCPYFTPEKKQDEVYSELFEYLEEYPKELYRIIYEITDAN